MTGEPRSDTDSAQTIKAATEMSSLLAIVADGPEERSTSIAWQRDSSQDEITQVPDVHQWIGIRYQPSSSLLLPLSIAYVISCSARDASLEEITLLALASGTQRLRFLQA